MRTSARNLALLFSLAVAASFSCSKTQDTAPERRIFGEPPIIQSVDSEYFAQQSPASCDFTDVLFSLFCQNGILDVVAQTGRGWTVVEIDGDRVIKKEDVESTEPGIFVTGFYSELNFKVSVVDPNSTAGNNNVLLVSSSYVSPESESETSLVLFDDGSDTNFQIDQKSNVPQACNIDIPNGTCVCVNARFDIQSGDQVKDDGTYTRRFTLLNKDVSLFLSDCIMRSRHVLGVPADEGVEFSFKIEAVDRQGNLTTWPTSLPAVTGDSSFACTGDSCGCCLLHANSQQAEITECADEPGMISPSSFPNGFCVDAL